jgi:DNA-binding response OmpR family regulator
MTAAFQALAPHFQRLARRPGRKCERPQMTSRALSRGGVGRVLVIEEDHDVLELIGHTVRRMGLRPLLASSEKQALALLDRGQPDCVVVGLPFCHRAPAELLRGLRRRTHLPLVVLGPACPTAAVSISYLAKPFSPRELACAIRTHLPTITAA